MSLTNVCYGFRSVATRRIIEPRLNRSESGLCQLRHEAGICFMTQSRRVFKKHPHYYEASDGSMPEDFTLTRFNRRTFHKSTSRQKRKDSGEVEDANENFLNLADYEKFLAESAERKVPNPMEESSEECNFLKTILEVQPDEDPHSINALEMLKDKAQEPILLPSRAWDEGEMIRFIDKVRSKLEMRRNRGGEKADTRVLQPVSTKIQYLDKKVPILAIEKLACPSEPAVTKLEAGVQCNVAANDKMTQASADREVQTDHDNTREVGTETSCSSRELPSTDSVLNLTAKQRCKPKKIAEPTTSTTTQELSTRKVREKKSRKADPSKKAKRTTSTKITDTSSTSTGSFMAYVLQTKKDASNELWSRPGPNDSQLEKLDQLLMSRRKSPKQSREVPDEIAAKLFRTESRRPPRRARRTPSPEKPSRSKRERPRVRASLSSLDWMKQFKEPKKKKHQKSTSKVKHEPNLIVKTDSSRRPKALPSNSSRQTCPSRDYCSVSSGQDSPRNPPKKKKKSKKVLVHEEHCPLFHSHPRRKKTSLTHAKVMTASSSPIQLKNRQPPSHRPKSTPSKRQPEPPPASIKKSVGLIGRFAWFRDRLSEMIS